MSYQLALLCPHILEYILPYVRNFKYILLLSHTCKYIKEVCNEIIDQYMSVPIHVDYDNGFVSPSYFWYRISDVRHDSNNAPQTNRNNWPRTISYQGSRGFITTRGQIFKNLYLSDYKKRICKYSSKERNNIFCCKPLTNKKNLMIESCSICQKHRDDYLMSDKVIPF